MKTLPNVFFLTIAFFFASASFSLGKDKITGFCSNKDRDYAKVWNNYYDPEDAYEFAEKIKKLVKDKNLEGLFNLVDGELNSGPRKGFVEGKNFFDIFSSKWRDNLLASPSPCSPVGWRGFMIDHGSIWFNKSRKSNKWHIFSILGAKKELISEENRPTGWKVSGKIVPPQCFATLWMSSDNYEEFANKFAIKNYEDFEKNPGLYFGKQILNLEPITSSWDDKIYLAASLKKCFKGNLRGGGVVKTTNVDIKIDKKSIKNKICETKFSCTEYEYTILSRVPLKKCKKLAPHIEGKCEESFLISLGDYSGGSIGWNMSYNIYGLFFLNDEQKYIIPLKNFYKKNDAINYIKKID